MLAPVRSVARPSVRSFSAASPWGTDGWRHDKNAFKAWCNAAVAPGVSKEKREFFGFLALSFGDVDVDKDGFINLEEFDRLLEKVAAVPRRYGLAPVQISDPLTRQMGHKKVFDYLDTKAGPARGVLGLDQFVEWAFEHVVAKVGKVPAKDVGLYHVQDYSEADYLGFIERAVNIEGSYERSSFYNFILNCFVEADEQCEGRITQDQFDKLLTRAATVPRHFGLAPPEGSAATRQQMFAEMSAGTGYVTVIHVACDAAALSRWRHTCVAAAEEPNRRGRVMAALYALVVAAGVLATTGVLCLLVAAQDFKAAMKKQLKSFELVSFEDIVKELAGRDTPEKKGDIIGDIIGKIIMALFAPIVAIVVYVVLLPFQICIWVVILPVLIPLTFCEVIFSSATGAIAVSAFLGLHAAAFSHLPWWSTAMAYASLPSCVLLLVIAGRLSFSP